MDVSDLDIVRGTFGDAPFFAAKTPPPLLAGITFRVEHLVLPSTSDVSVDYHNGTVDNLFTTIWAGGQPQAVREYLERVPALLGEFPLERLEVERRILAAEQDSQSGTSRAYSLTTSACWPSRPEAGVGPGASSRCPDRRLRFVAGDDGPKSYVFENGELNELRADGSSLEFVAAGEQMRITGIEPSGQAEELARLLRRNAQASS